MTTPRIDPLAYLGEQLNEFRANGTYQRLRELQGPCEPISRYDGRDVINLASNNYLGLANHPKLKEAAIEAVRRFGAGTGAVRTISGTLDMHMELERRIAAFKHVEACVVFQSGFTANAGAVSAVLGKEDHVISDELNHASIIDGCRLSRAKIHVFPHADIAAAAAKLEALDGVPGRKLLITDGVFSMDGDVAPLDQLSSICTAHDAWLMSDDAHGLGVLAGGRGSAALFPGADIPLQMGTLSKAVGGYGGYLCASAAVIELIRNRARTFVYSTGLPPASAAAAIAALDVIQAQPELCALPLAKAQRFTAAAGLPPAQSPIVAVVLGEAEAALAASARLEAEGFLAVAIRPPTVPPGTARLRFTFTAEHADADIDRLAALVRDLTPAIA